MVYKIIYKQKNAKSIANMRVVSPLLPKTLLLTAYL